MPGIGCKVTPGTLSETVSHYEGHTPHQVVPAAFSFAQATEAGTIYRPDEIAALAKLAREHGMTVHMDGARFANALVRLNASPAQATWRAGVDVLSFGATKGGAMAAEAVVFFDRALAEHMAERRKRAGQLLSKHRYLALQFQAYLANDYWLRLARHANAMADLLASRLASIGLPPAWPVEANLVFVVLPKAVEARLRASGARYYVRHSESLGAATGSMLDPVGDLLRHPRGRNRAIRDRCRKGAITPPQRCPNRRRCLASWDGRDS
jgi:threonine aldolase